MAYSWETPEPAEGPKYSWEPGYKPPVEKGIIQTVTERFSSGLESQGVGTSVATGRSAETIGSDIADVHKYKATEQETEYKQGMAEKAKAFSADPSIGGLWEIASHLASSPKQLAGEVAQSVGSSLPGYGGAAAGAALGSVVPGVGTVVGGIVGYLAGNLASNVQSEIAGSVEAKLSERGVDLKDKDAITAAIKADPEIFKGSVNESLVRGGATTAVESVFDLATLGVGSKLLKPATSTAQRMTRGALAAGGQGVAEGSGAAAADLASGRPMEPGQYMTEGLIGTFAEGPVGIVELAAASRKRDPVAVVEPVLTAPDQDTAVAAAQDALKQTLASVEDIDLPTEFLQGVRANAVEGSAGALESLIQEQKSMIATMESARDGLISREAGPEAVAAADPATSPEAAAAVAEVEAVAEAGAAAPTDPQATAMASENADAPGRPVDAGADVGQALPADIPQPAAGVPDRSLGIQGGAAPADAQSVGLPAGSGGVTNGGTAPANVAAGVRPYAEPDTVKIALLQKRLETVDAQLAKVPPGSKFHEQGMKAREQIVAKLDVAVAEAEAKLPPVEQVVEAERVPKTLPAERVPKTLPGPETILDAIARQGGMSMREARATFPGLTEQDLQREIGGQRIFHQKGMGVESMRVALADEGYLDPTNVTELEEKVGLSLKGTPQYTGSDAEVAGNLAANADPMDALWTNEAEAALNKLDDGAVERLKEDSWDDGISDEELDRVEAELDRIEEEGSDDGTEEALAQEESGASESGVGEENEEELTKRTSAALLGGRKTEEATKPAPVLLTRTPGTEGAETVAPAKIPGADLLGGRKSPEAAKSAPALLRSLKAGETAEGTTEVRVGFLPEKRTANADGSTTLSRREAGMLQKLARLFGKRVVFFQGKVDYDGYVKNDGDNSTLYININSSSAHHLVVAGHEIAHLMKRDNPGLYQALVDRLLPEITKGNLEKFARYYDSMETKSLAEKRLRERPTETNAQIWARLKEGNETTQQTYERVRQEMTDAQVEELLRDPTTTDKIVEEFICDLIGNRAGELRTFTKLFGAVKKDGDQNLIYQIGQFIMDFVDGLLAKIKVEKFETSDALVKDLRTARRDIRQTLLLYAKEQNQNGPLELMKAQRDLIVAKRVPSTLSTESAGADTTGGSPTTEIIENGNAETRQAGREEPEERASEGGEEAGAEGVVPLDGRDPGTERPGAGGRGPGQAELSKSTKRGVTDSPAFRKWFAGSRVVDKDGLPLVVHHGAPDARFAKPGGSGIFATMRDRNGMDEPRRAFFFAADTRAAKTYADPHRAWDYQNAEEGIVSVYLALRNPLEVDAQGKHWRGTDAMIDKAMKEGHDGAIIRNVRDDYASQRKENGPTTTVYVAFKSEQIKSATDNDGNFDAANPNITKSKKRDTFYSALAREVEGNSAKAMPAVGWKQQLGALVKNGKIKQDEVEWTGLGEWLDLQQGKVTKEAVNQFLKENGVQVTETELADAPGERMTTATEAFEFLRRSRGVDEAEVRDRWGYENDEDYVDLANNLRAEEESGEAEGYATTKYGKYQLPGGKDYKELLLTLPAKVDTARLAETRDAVRNGTATPEVRAEFDRLNEAAASAKASGELYRSSHFDQPNIVAHVRFNSRTDADGKKVLFIEELQSDWAQAGKKKGFALPAYTRAELKLDVAESAGAFWAIDVPDNSFRISKAKYPTAEAAMDYIVKEKKRAGGSIPVGPFVQKTDAWLGLGIKRMIAYGVDNGFDKIAFVNGKQSADRYDLSKQISAVEYEKFEDQDRWEVNALGMDGRQIFDEDGMDLDRIEEVLGKEIAKKIAADEGKKGTGGGYRNWRTLSGLDLEVGGEGMKTFYDQIVPKVAKDVLKKLGGQMGSVKFAGDRIKEVKPFFDEATQLWFAIEPGSRPLGPTFSTEEEAQAKANQVMEKRRAMNLIPDMEQTGFEITAAMKEKVASGLPLFSKKRQAVEQGDVGVQNQKFFGGGQTFVSSLKSKVDPSMIAATQNGEVVQAVVEAIPVDVMDMLADQEFSAEQLASNPKVFLAELPVDRRLPVANGLIDALAKVRADLRAGLDAAFLAGGDGEILPALNASDLDTDVAAGILFSSAGVGRLGAATPRTEPGSQRAARLADVEGDTAARADFIEWHEGIVNDLAPMAEKVEAGMPLFSKKRSAERVPRTLQTETPEFKNWFGDSKIVDGDGKPLRLFHGTTADFSEFNRGKSNVESDLGAGFYFSNNPKEIEANYAGLGPDLKAKIEREKERLDVGKDYSEGFDSEPADTAAAADIDAMARAKWMAHDGATMPVYLKMENPMFIGGPKDTKLTYEQEYDEEADEYGEEKGTLLDFIQALQDIASGEDFFGGEVDGLIGELMEEASGNEGIKASKLIEIAKANEQFGYYTDQEGDTASNEILRQAAEQAGFDGFIDNTVNVKFGSERLQGKSMTGMGKGTIHFIAFKPEQIKSAIGNSGAFDPQNPDITKSTKRVLGTLPPVGSATARLTQQRDERVLGTLSKRDVTESPPFKSWFSGSAVVDADGKPKRVYHGTTRDFSKFNPKAKQVSGDVGYLGSFFTDSTKLASAYAEDLRGNAKEGGQVIPVYLSLKNPRIESIEKMEDIEQSWDKKQVAAYKARLLREGHDGIVFQSDGASEFVAFRPEQIKSAISNTTFDPANPDITKSTKRDRGFIGDVTPAQEAALRNVGGIVVPETRKERMAKLTANLGIRVKQGLVDQFAAIKEIDPKAYLLARMSKGSEGALEAMMMYGKVTIRDGLYDVKVGPDGGFAKVLADLEGEHDRFLWWVAAQRAERLKAEGRENLFTDTDIADLKTLNVGREAKFTKALAELNSYNESVLKIALDSGLIDPDAYQMFKDQPYVPFYRVLADENAPGGPTFSSGMKGQYASKKLKGGKEALNQDLLSNMMQNWSHLFSASIRTRAMEQTMTTAESMGVAYPVPSGTKGSIKFMRQGSTQHYMVEDPYLFEAISAVDAQTPSWMAPFSKFKQILTVGVTASPTFKIRNLIRDSLGAIAQADLSYNPARNIAEGFAATARGSQTYASMLASGGVIKFGAMADGASGVQRMVRKAAKSGTTILDKQGLEKLTGQMADLWESYNEKGDRFENANRAALYQQMIAKGKSHAEASFMSRDLMDFSMSGRWPVVRFLAQSIPFLNARIIGLNRLVQGAQEDPRRMGYMVAAVATASIALAMAQGDDEDFKKLEDFERDGAWHFKIGGFMFAIPKPFELGAMGTLAERTYELMVEPEMTSKRYRERIAHMFSQTFALNPIPQIIKPFVDLNANKDSFSNRAIESMGMEKLKKADRYNERTTMTARFLGQLGLPDPAQLMMGRYDALSPVQMDHLFRAYFGWLGTVTTVGLDYGLRPLADRGAKPEMQLRDVFIVGNFVKTLPTGQSRYLTQLYEQANEIEQAYSSYREAVKTGDKPEAEKRLAADKKLIDMYPRLTKDKKTLADLNSRAKQVESSRDLSAEAKRVQLDLISAQRNKLAEEVSRRMTAAR